MLLSEQEFIGMADSILSKIQYQAEEWFDTRADIDIDVFRSGNVVTIIFANQTQIIINSQEPKKEIWMAAVSGGYHFYYDTAAQQWLDTKTQIEFYAKFLEDCRMQSGVSTLEMTR